MREFDSRIVRSKINRYSVPIVALLVVLIGGALKFVQRDYRENPPAAAALSFPRYAE